MPIKIFTQLNKWIDGDITQLEEWKDFFEKKIAEQQGVSTPENKNNWSTAYEGPYSNIKTAGGTRTATSGGDKQVDVPHNQKRLIDKIYRDLTKIQNRATIIEPTIKMMENDIQKSFKHTNLEINESKGLYEIADENYKNGKNVSTATNILKIDSYDRNIEENFYIMYYLLSYGVLGFFIYKLLKL